jgi:hypothetical protein
VNGSVEGVSYIVRYISFTVPLRGVKCERECTRLPSDHEMRLHSQSLAVKYWKSAPTSKEASASPQRAACPHYEPWHAENRPIIPCLMPQG